MVLKVGSRINQKYEIIKRIRTGGMSTVYIVTDTRLNKNWALKEINKSAKGRSKIHEVEYKSLITEANILKELSHVYLPSIVDVLEDPTRFFVVMEYIEGKTFHDVITSNGPLEEHKVVKWAIQIATVLGYLHGRDTPIIYRDMKPANIMLQPNGDIKLFDFGAARFFEGVDSWKTQPLGTKGYAAPERYAPLCQFDARSDIYEFGMTLYHMLTGHDPSSSAHKIKPIPYRNPNVSPGLVKVIEKMTKTDPNDRYQTTGELLYDLRNYDALDDSYKGTLKKRLKMMGYIGVATASLFALSGLGYFIDNIVVERQYKAKIEQAQTEKDTYIAVEATHIKPKDLRAYSLMVDLFQEDGVFTEVEDAQVISTINPTKSILQGKQGYGELAYTIASLYFYYGEGLEDSTKRANEWADIAYKSMDNKSKAKELKMLIGLHKEIEEGDSTNTQSNLTYWEILSSEVEGNAIDNLVTLKDYKLVYNLVDKNLSILKEGDISKEEITGVLIKIKESVDQIKPVNDSEKELSDEIKTMYSFLTDKVEKEYR